MRIAFNDNNFYISLHRVLVFWGEMIFEADEIEEVLTLCL